MRFAAALLLVSSFSTLSFGDTQTLKDSHLAVTVPDGWKLATKPAGITGESKDKEVALLAWPVDDVTADGAKKKLEGELYSAVASLKWEKPGTGKSHDLVVTYLTGTGHAVGGDLVVKAAVIGPAGKKQKAMLVALAVKTDKFEAHKAEIQTILDGIAPPAK